MNTARSSRARTFCRIAVTVALAAGAFAPRLCEACAVCFKDPEDPQTIGVNAAVLGMLAVTLAMLLTFGGFFLHLRRRSRSYYADHPLAGAAFENPDPGDPGEPCERGSREDPSS